jgi:hypothetical protein
VSAPELRRVSRVPYKEPMGECRPAETGKWQIVKPEEAVAWLSSVTVPWWVAGGWALDLFVGKQTRDHGDLDIGVLRRDSMHLLDALSSWEVCEAKDGTLTRLGAAPRADVNSLWCRPLGTTSWTIEVLLDASDDDFWVFRRQTHIRRRLSEVIRRNPHGIPYLAPEVQLLYKARSMRPRDEADFDHIAPQLDFAARRWLRDSLLGTDPTHAWISALDDRESHWTEPSA